MFSRALEIMDTLQIFNSFKEDNFKFHTHIKKSRSVQIKTKTFKNKGKKLVQKYFRDIRPQLYRSLPEEGLLKIDGHFQQLLSLTNADSSQSKYLSIMKLIKKELDQLEIQLTTMEGQNQSNANQTLSQLENLILNTLKKLKTSAYLSYKQALLDLSDKTRVSYKGTANEMRETVREVLDYLAPDKEIIKQKNFKLEKGRDKPTQKQKVHFILTQRNKSKQYIRAPEKAVQIIDNLKGDFTRAVYSQSAMLVHKSPSKHEIQTLKRYLDNVLAELLELTEI